MIEQVRRVAAASVFVRGLLYAVLAVCVTAGGVLAGALVVAPVVARATKHSVSAEQPPTPSNAQAARVSTFETAIAGALAVRANMLASLPKSVTRFAPPVLVVVSIAGALVAIFARREARPIRPPGRVSANRHRTPQAVEAMAANGASTTDIAWRTGLPIDAVQLLLAISSAPRQLQPPAA